MALALSACGGVSGGTRDRGYPTANPRVAQHARRVAATLAGLRVRMPLPAGWDVTRQGRTRGAATRAALTTVIRASPPCYLSASITGGARRDIDAREIEALYQHPSAGYGWRVDHVGGALLALLDQYDSAGTRLSRTTLGTAWLPLTRRTYLAVDIGAGIWPLGSGNCSDPAVASRLSALHAGIAAMIAGARLSVPTTPAAPGTTAEQ